MIVNDGTGAPAPVLFGAREFAALVKRINTHPRWRSDGKAKRIAILAGLWKQAEHGVCTLYPESACSSCDSEKCYPCPHSCSVMGTFDATTMHLSVGTGASQRLVSNFLRWLRSHGYVHLGQDPYDERFYVFDYAAIRRDLIDSREDGEGSSASSDSE